MAHIALLGNSDIPRSAIEDVVVAADLPPGEMALLIGDDLLEKFQGLTAARRFLTGTADLYGLEEHAHRSWDVGVTISRKWTELQGQCPAYFSYLLAHELGHAKTILGDPLTAAYETFITSFFRGAGCTAHLWHDLPYERRYDQFGKAIAHEVHGEDAFRQDLLTITAQRLSDGQERIDFLLTLAPRRDLDGLRAELAAFALPCKEKLLEIWSGARQLPANKAEQQIPDLAQLWSAS